MAEDKKVFAAAIHNNERASFIFDFSKRRSVFVKHFETAIRNRDLGNVRAAANINFTFPILLLQDPTNIIPAALSLLISA